MTRSAAGACVAAANWTTGYVARSGGGGLRRGVCVFLRYLLCHSSCIIILPRERVIHAAARSSSRDALASTRLPSPSPSMRLFHRSQPTRRFFRVTTGTRPCEAVTDWTPRVTRVMMRAQHARLNGLVLAEHLGIRT